MVVKKLCNEPTLPGQEAQALVRPDPASLEATLRENDVVGQVLLEDVDKKALLDDFKIKSLGQRSALERAIRFLRSQSATWSRKNQLIPVQCSDEYGPITPFSHLPGPSYSPRPSLGYSEYRSPAQQHHAFDLSATPSDRDRRPTVPLFHSGKDISGRSQPTADRAEPRSDFASGGQDVHEDIDGQSQRNEKVDCSILVPAKRHRISIGQEGFEPSIVASIEQSAANNGHGGVEPLTDNEDARAAKTTATIRKKRRIAPTLVSTITSIDKRASNDFQSNADAFPHNSQNLNHTQGTSAAERDSSQRYYRTTGINFENIFYGTDAEENADTWTTVGESDASGTRQLVGELIKHFLQQPIETIQGIKGRARVPYTAFRLGETLATHHRRQFLTMFQPHEAPVVRNAANFPGLKSRGLGPLGRKRKTITNPLRESISPSSLPDSDRTTQEKDEFERLLEKYPPKHEDEDIEVSMAHSVGSLDEETWKELQEEQEEKSRSRRALLSAETVNSVIEDCISVMSSTWQDFKRPKFARKVFRLWHRANKFGGRDVETGQAKKRLAHIEQLLAKGKEHIANDEWPKVEGVQRLCQGLEEYVFQREEQRYILTALSKDHPPPKPGTRPPPREKASIIDLGTDEEVLESESAPSSTESNLSDFVEEDEVNKAPRPVRDNTPLLYSDTSGEPSQGRSNLRQMGKDSEAKSSMDTEGNMSDSFADDEKDPDSSLNGRTNERAISPVSPKKALNLPFLPDSTEESERTDDTVSPSGLPEVDELLNRPSKPEDYNSDLDAKLPTLPPSRFALKGHEKDDPIALSSDGPDSFAGNLEIHTPPLKPTVADIPRRTFDPQEVRGLQDQPIKQDQVHRGAYDEAEHRKLLELAKKRSENQQGNFALSLSQGTNTRSEVLNMRKIKSMSIEELESNSDHKRLLAKLIYASHPNLIKKLHKFTFQNDLHYLGVIVEQGLKNMCGCPNHLRGEKRYKTALALCKYYASFAHCKDLINLSTVSTRLAPRVWQTAMQPDNYEVFFDTLRAVLDVAYESNSEKRKRRATAFQSDDSLQHDDAEWNTANIEENVAEQDSSTSSSVEDDSDDQSLPQNKLTPHKKRVRKVAESQDALAAQRSDHLRVQRLELQKKRIKLRVASFGESNDNASEHIIGYGDPPIYLDPEIGQRVKPHQVEGTSFLWREIVDDEKRQGCLLAHTMGLGKTMQVISLLVTIALSKQADNERIRTQVSAVPNTRTLVLCPPSLIDNWIDEFTLWVPDRAYEILGPCQKISSQQKIPERVQIIHDWYSNEGVLVISYDMLRTIIRNTARKGLKQPLSEERHARVMKELLDGPAIVVGDEAHKMKNHSSALSQVTSKFKTTSRIALTGSPLANNLEEYYAMINWIAPGYLGNATQFRAKYKEPIEEGLYSESTTYEQRRSLKRLQILKEDLEPKVCRADITAIKQDLPQKTEFFITIGLSKLQTRAYKLYVDAILGRAAGAGIARLWDWLAVLSILCNHPSCFYRKLADRSFDIDRAKSGRKVASTDDPEGESLPADVNMKDLGLPKAMIDEQLQVFEKEEDINDPTHSARTDILLRLVDACLRIKDKVLIFSHSIPTLDYLENLLRNENHELCRLDGATKMATRQDTTKLFNQENGRFNIFLISTRAGGLGLNLPGANRVIIFDFGYNPQWEEQAIGRAYRLGQTKPVFVYRFCSGGTFESVIKNKTIFKTQLAARVVDKKNFMRSASKKVSDYLFSPKDVPCEDLSEVQGKDPEVLDCLLAHKAIKSIVLTETFQRELEETLTAEERKEVQQEIEDEKLKRKDPKAFEAVLAQRTGGVQASSSLNAPNGGRAGFDSARPALGLDPAIERQIQLDAQAASVVAHYFNKHYAPTAPGAMTASAQTTRHFPNNRQPSPPLDCADVTDNRLRASSQAPGPIPQPKTGCA